jgi:CDP-diacylglycerol--serine O-phosphatidyltransferase
MQIKNHVPNSITLINLFSGCCGIIACLQSQYKLVPIFIAISLIADFLDGFLARLMNVKSELGGQLDSLADMVTFGVLPGMMLFSIINHKINFIHNTSTLSLDFYNPSDLIALIAFIYTLFACVRLAKFNLDTRQTVNFIGLNTPACSILILGFYMQFFTNWQHQLNWDFSINAKIAAMVLPLILAYFLIAEIEIFSMKGNPFSWKQNKFRVLFIISCLPILFFFKWIGLSICIINYVIFALMDNYSKKQSS